MAFHHRIVAALLRPVISRASRRSLPRTSGRLGLDGLSFPVMIHRDRWGIPHIEAQDRGDLFFAQGVVHAQDRLWQLELNRRAATGRLAEIIGQTGLETDRLARTLGFNRLAKETWNTAPEQIRRDVEAYTSGINGYLRTDPKLPVEFTLLRHRPEAWRPQDSIALGRMMAWTLSHVWAGKLARAKLIEAVGPEAANQLDAHYPKNNPVTLPQGIEFNMLEPDAMFYSSGGPFLGRTIEGGSRGSNGWVLSPSLTNTGNPILCNDMHLPITTPSLWYYLHLRCQKSENLHAAGVSLPGVPYVLVGHNEHIAWGATVSFIDTEDLFIEQLNQDDALLYRYRDAWLPVQVLEERISIKGSADHVEQVRMTQHGPIISPVEADSNQVLALQSVALQPGESFAGFALLNEAKSWSEFAHAVQQIETPALNILYADIAGNIGYYLSGRMPVRAQVRADVPVPGWDGDYEWIGRVPFEEMPHAINPEQGYIVSANHRIVGDDYPYYLGRSWRNGYRAKRIDDQIKTKRRMSVDDCRRLQMDDISIPGQLISNKLSTLDSEDPDATLCFDLLREWGGHLGVDSVGGTVYQIVISKLARAILGSQLKPKLVDLLLGSGPEPVLYPTNELHGQWPAILIRLLDDPDTSWLPTASKREGFICQVLAESVVELRGLLGDNPDKWTWGRLHQIQFDHAFSARPPFGQIFSLGPFSIGGDADTIAQASLVGDDPGDNIAPSYRQIIDLGDLDQAMAIHAPGQSGQIGSSFYSDLIGSWFTGDYYTMTLDVDSVKKVTEESLELFPT